MSMTAIMINLNNHYANTYGGHENEHPFGPARKVFGLAMSIQMISIGWTGGNGQHSECHQRASKVDKRFQCI